MADRLIGNVTGRKRVSFWQCNNWWGFLGGSVACCWQGGVVGRGYAIDLEYRAGHGIRWMINWSVENRRDA